MTIPEDEYQALVDYAELHRTETLAINPPYSQYEKGYWAGYLHALMDLQKATAAVRSTGTAEHRRRED